MEWRERAACLDVDPELFFPISDSGPSRYRTQQALAVCAGCPVRAECLDWSLEQNIMHGVWGGLSEDQRATVLRRRQRATVNESVPQPIGP
jgi:WhiB family transcriptional regulator, redox-sensing transcriptional regulator